MLFLSMLQLRGIACECMQRGTPLTTRLCKNLGGVWLMEIKRKFWIEGDIKI